MTPACVIKFSIDKKKKERLEINFRQSSRCQLYAGVSVVGHNSTKTINNSDCSRREASKRDSNFVLCIVDCLINSLND